MTTTATAERWFVITDSDFNESSLGHKLSLAEAEREAQYHADKNARKVYIAWQADNGMTTCQPVEPRGTADYLSTFAANDSETYSTYFLPIAQRIQQLYPHKKNREQIIEQMTPRANSWAEFAEIRHTRERARHCGHPIRFTTDTKRQAAQDMLTYILDEIDAGNSWS